MLAYRIIGARLRRFMSDASSLHRIDVRIINLSRDTQEGAIAAVATLRLVLVVSWISDVEVFGHGHRSAGAPTAEVTGDEVET